MVTLIRAKLDFLLRIKRIQSKLFKKTTLLFIIDMLLNNESIYFYRNMKAGVDTQAIPHLPRRT